MNKICYVCEAYENPYINRIPDLQGNIHIDNQENPENFITIHWFGTDKSDPAHEQCWYMENN